MKEILTTMKFCMLVLCLGIGLTACGGGSDNGNNNNNKNGNTPTISISQSAVKAYVGESKTIPVTTQNTDFTVSVEKSGSGCEKSGNNII